MTAALFSYRDVKAHPGSIFFTAAVFRQLAGPVLAHRSATRRKTLSRLLLGRGLEQMFTIRASTTLPRRMWPDMRRPWQEGSLDLLSDTGSNREAFPEPLVTGSEILEDALHSIDARSDVDQNIRKRLFTAENRGRKFRCGAS